MSRSNPTQTTPVHRYMTWAGGAGELQYYDKEAKERIKIPLPFTFMVLDELTSIGGFSDADKSGIWSNEVRSTKDQLIVKTSSGTIAKGDYTSLKDHLKAQGAKYARSVYVAYQEPKGEDFEWVIGNIKFVGAGLGAWFEFTRSTIVTNIATRLTGSTMDKKGATTFHVPTFEVVHLSESDADTAYQLDIELQQYLKDYFSKGTDKQIISDVVESERHEEADAQIDLSEIPF